MEPLTSVETSSEEALASRERPLVEESFDENLFPFYLPPLTTKEGVCYLKLKRESFWNFKNFHVDYLFNYPNRIKNYINSKAPVEVPTINDQQTIAFFVDITKIELNTLENDSMCPWSQKQSNNTYYKLIKSLEMDDQGKLRVLNHNLYLKYTYCLINQTHESNIQRRIVYLLKDGIPFGTALVMYKFNFQRELRNYPPGCKNKLFEMDLSITSCGDHYLTVLGNRVDEFLNALKILDILTHPAKYKLMIHGDLLLRSFPRLPPLISGKGCFVFFVKGSKKIKSLKIDALGTWETTEEVYPITNNFGWKPDINSKSYYNCFCIVTARNTKVERLTKKICYVTRNNQTHRNIMVIYNYESPGEIPEVKPKFKYQEAMQALPMSRPIDDFTNYPDNLANGFDIEFSDKEDQNTNPYYEMPRVLSTGHIYLTVQNKEKAKSAEFIFNLLMNPDMLKSQNLLNITIPNHPPLVTNSRIYAFFLDPSLKNSPELLLDDFTRSGNEFIARCQETHTKREDPNCPLCLIHQLVAYQHEPRLTKSVYYLEGGSREYPVLIHYDYKEEGWIPRLSKEVLEEYNGFKDRGSSIQPITIN